jgi:hypothetical protein
VGHYQVDFSSGSLRTNRFYSENVSLLADETDEI